MSLRGGSAGELHDADRDGEEEEHAGHGEEGEQAEDERLRLIAAEKAQAEDRADQDRRQKQHTADMARTIRAVDRFAGRRVALISHVTSLSLRKAATPKRP